MSYVGTTYVGDRIPSIRQTNVYVGDVSLTFDPTATINKQYIITGDVTSVYTPSSNYYENRIITGDVSLTVTPDSTMVRRKVLTTAISLMLEANSSGKIEYTKVGRMTEMLTDMLTQKIPIDWEEILDG